MPRFTLSNGSRGLVPVAHPLSNAMNNATAAIRTLLGFWFENIYSLPDIVLASAGRGKSFFIISIVLRARERVWAAMTTRLPRNPEAWVMQAVYPARADRQPA